MLLKQLSDVASLIDHTNLKAYASDADLKKLCEEAMTYHFRMVAINSSRTAFCHDILKDSDVHVGAAISFPLGQTDTSVKLFETKTAIEEGADEIDYVVSLSDVKNGAWDKVEDEMKQMTELCHAHGILIKVIFEICYLNEEEIVHLARMASAVKPDFIKTSTGFGTGGARAEIVRLMKENCGPDVKVKAAGGIRTWQAFKEMVAAGAERIGTSSGVQIMQEAEKELG
jgi:deoxyribose-phosphate aldolase